MIAFLQKILEIIPSVQLQFASIPYLPLQIALSHVCHCVVIVYPSMPPMSPSFFFESKFFKMTKLPMSSISLHALGRWRRRWPSSPAPGPTAVAELGLWRPPMRRSSPTPGRLRRRRSSSLCMWQVATAEHAVYLASRGSGSGARPPLAIHGQCSKEKGGRRR